MLQISQSNDATIFFQPAVSLSDETGNNHMGLGLVKSGGGAELTPFPAAEIPSQHLLSVKERCRGGV